MSTFAPLPALLLLLLAAALAGGCRQETAVDPPADAAVAPADPAEAERIEQLSAIGYVAGSDPAGPATGVTLHQPERAEPGLNLLTSGHGPVAVLMDMEGRVLHEWRAEFGELFPDDPKAARGVAPRTNFWRDAQLLPNGDLVAIWDLRGIFKLDRDSKVIWAAPGRAHHDFQLTDDGRIHHLAAKRRPMPEIGEELAVDDYLVVRDALGAELSRLAVSDALRGIDWPGLRDAFWERARARGYGLRHRARTDPFHTNALRILSPDEARRLGDPFRPGDALISMAMLDAIAVIDMQAKSVRWWQQGPFGMQHRPRITPDGGIMVFNNFLAVERSSVQIFDPHTHELSWEYGGPEAAPLYSRRSAGADLLPGGNILIVETDRGRALEITPEGELVWEFRSPYRTGKRGDRTAALYSLDRVDPSLAGWLDR